MWHGNNNIAKQYTQSGDLYGKDTVIVCGAGNLIIQQLQFSIDVLRSFMIHATAFKETLQYCICMDSKNKPIIEKIL